MGDRIDAPSDAPRLGGPHRTLLDETCALLGRELGADRVHLVEFSSRARVYRVRHAWAARDAAPLQGRGALAPFGHAIFDAYARGHTVAIEDVRRDPRTARCADAFLSAGAASLVSAPLVRDGALLATLSVDHGSPRRWRATQIERVTQAAAAAWTWLGGALAAANGQETEAKYRTLLESIDEGYCVIEVLVDPQGVPCDYLFVEANRAFAVQSGLGDPVGRRARELVPGLEDHWVRTYGDVARSGRPIRFQQASAAMQARWFDVYAFRIGGAADRRVGILFRDVSAHRRAELARDASEARLRMLSDSAPAMVWMTEPDGACCFMSRGWFEYTGQSPDEALGSGWLEAVHPDDRSAAATVFAEANALRHPFELDYRLRGTDGQYRWAVDAGRPRYDTDGAFAGYVGSVIDVHRRRLAEDSLRAADRRKDEFLAMLGHELRNPLAPVRNAIEVLRREAALSPRGEQAIGLASRQLAHMGRMLDDLLDASRISRGAIELRRELVSLTGLLREVCESAESVAHERGQRLDLAVPDADLRVLADPARIAQIAGNLVGNALKFSAHGATVEVGLVPAARGGAEIRVTDRGVGLPRDRLEDVFELFTQVSPTHGAGQAGLGIGLAMVRRLAELHGGRAWAHSDGPGRGSTFFVHLPQDGGERPDARS